MTVSRSAWLMTSGLALIAAAGLASVASGKVVVPLYRLPAPSGALRVGTQLIAVPGIVNSDALTNVQVWYPIAEDVRGASAPYILVRSRPLRTRLIDGFVATNAVLNAPVAPGRHPCIVTIPGWGGKLENNTAIAESLASHGDIVFGIDDLVEANRAMTFDSAREAKATVAWANEKLERASANVSRVLDAIEQLDRVPGGKFEGRVDPNRMGLVGFSFGGAVAAETSLHDSRVLASVNLDGSMYGESLRSGVSKPFLFMLSTPPASEDDPAKLSFADRVDVENRRRIFEGLRHYRDGFFTLKHSGHYNYADASLLPSIRHTLVGSVDPVRAHEAIAYYVNRFLDTYVRRQGPPRGLSDATFSDVGTFEPEGPRSDS